MYCGLSSASEVFLIFTNQLYQYSSVFLLFTMYIDEPEVFLLKYSQTAILPAAPIPRVENALYSSLCSSGRDEGGVGGGGGLTQDF